jgi:hypothetical protein
LPTGVRLIDNPSTPFETVTGSPVYYRYRIAGTPTIAGESYDIKLTASGSSVPSFCVPTPFVFSFGSGTVMGSALPLATAPTINGISNNIFQINVTYSGSITINNCTSASIVNGTLPSGLNWSGSQSGSNYVITISGIPSTALQNYDIKVDATNAPAGFSANTVNGVSAGSGRVRPRNCLTPPTVTLNNTEFIEGTPYTGKLTITNANILGSVYSTVYGNYLSGVMFFPLGISAAMSSSNSAANSFVVDLYGTPSLNDADRRTTDPNPIIVVQNSEQSSCWGNYTDTLLTLPTITVKCGTAPSLLPSLVSVWPALNTIKAEAAYNATFTLKNVNKIVSVTGLPEGLKWGFGVCQGGCWNQSTREYRLLISGTPTLSTSGTTFNISVTGYADYCDTQTNYTIQIGSGTVQKSISETTCATPAATLSSNTFKAYAAYSGSITINNATTATLSGLPTGIIASGAPSGSNYVFTLSGTPTASAQKYTISVTAQNNCIGKTASSISTTTIATGTVSPADPCTMPTLESAPQRTTAQVGKSYQAKIVFLNTTAIEQHSIVSALPAGLSFGTPVISGTSLEISVTGTPAASTAGLNYVISLRPNNSDSRCSTVTAEWITSLYINVSPPTPSCAAPTATLSNTKFQVDNSYQGKIVVSNATSASVIASSLPPGISVDNSTVVGNGIEISLNGTPDATTSRKSYTFQVTATNSGSQCITTTATLSVPSITVTPTLCPAPTSTFSSGTFQALVPIAAGTKIIINNATSATITGFPTGVYATEARSGTNYEYTLIGTHVLSDGGKQYNLVINATNACSADKTTTTTTFNIPISVLAAPPCPAPTTAPPAPDPTFVLKVSRYERQRRLGMTDAEARAVVEGIYGAQSDSDWNAVVSASSYAPTPAPAPTPSTTSTFFSGTLQALVPIAAGTKIVIYNATSANLGNGTTLPSGVSMSSFTRVGANIEYTLSGTTDLSAGGKQYNLVIDATNACSADKTPTTTRLNIPISVLAATPCPAPTTTSTFSSGTFQALVSIAAGTKIVINNATSANFGNDTTLPSGVSIPSFTRVGANIEYTLSGIPDLSAGGKQYNLVIDATNACSADKTPTTTRLNIPISVLAAPQCDIPSPQIFTGTFKVGVPVAAETKIIINNATSATISGFPTGVTASGARSGTNYEFTLSGTPDLSANSKAYTIIANITNACGGGKITTALTSVQLGAGTVLPPDLCSASSPQTINPNVFVQGQTYQNGIITVNNATSATISGLPTGISQTGQRVGSDYVFTISGIPTKVDETYAITIDAINNCGSGKLTTTATNLSGGNGKVNPPPLCDTPSLSSSLDNIAFTKDRAYSGKLVIFNATTATISGLPTGISSVGSRTGANYEFILSGIPTQELQSWDIRVNASNACGGGKVTTSITNSSFGSGQVARSSICKTNYASVEVTGATTGGTVCGSGPYTDDSNIAMAAVHAGLIKVEQKATINITSAGYSMNYSSSTKNGVATTSWTRGWCGITLSVVSNCALPSVLSRIETSTFKVGVSYGPIKIVVNNATTASISGLPTGISSTGAVVGSNYEFTLSGTPSTLNQSWDALISASNICEFTTSALPAPFSIGAGSVTEPNKCADPIVGQLLPNDFKVGVNYTGTVTITNATSASFNFITSLSVAGIRLVSSTTSPANGGTVILNFAGRPTTVNQRYDIRLNATNNPGISAAGCTIKTKNNVSVAVGTVK